MILFFIDNIFFLITNIYIYHIHWIQILAKNLDHELKQVEEKSRLMTRRNTRRISRVLMGGGGIPLKVLLEAAKENNNNGRYYYHYYYYFFLIF